MSISVSLRVKPAGRRLSPNVTLDEAMKKVTVVSNTPLTFSFDYILDPTDGKKAYDQKPREITEGLWHGVNGTGKTTTIQQLETFAIDDVFKKIAMDKAHRDYRVTIAYFQVYKEKLHDLLEGDPAKPKPRLCCNEKNITIIGLSNVEVRDKDEAMALLKKGRASRITAMTPSNKQSSRAHTFTRITVESNLPGGNAQKQALLQLVDLAGSEKVDASHDPLRTAETKNINTSISALNLVVEQLVTKQPHISYRNSHLTKLLEGSLCGNAFVLIVCTITLDMGTEESTLSTLRFAGNAKRVDITCNTPKGNNHNEPSAAEVLEKRCNLLTTQVTQLQEELEKMKQEAITTAELTTMQRDKWKYQATSLKEVITELEKQNSLLSDEKEKTIDVHKPHANTEEIEMLKQQETALRAAVERERAGSVQLSNRLQQIDTVVNEVIDMISTRELNDDGVGDGDDDDFYDDNTPGTDFVNTLELQKRYFLRKIKGIEELHKRALESEKRMAQNSYDDLMNKLQESTDNQDSLNIKIAMKEEQNAKQELEIELYINDLEKTEKSLSEKNKQLVAAKNENERLKKQLEDNIRLESEQKLLQQLQDMEEREKAYTFEAQQMADTNLKLFTDHENVKQQLEKALQDNNNYVDVVLELEEALENSAQEKKVMHDKFDTTIAELRSQLAGTTSREANVVCSNCTSVVNISKSPATSNAPQSTIPTTTTPPPHSEMDINNEFDNSDDSNQINNSSEKTGHGKKRRTIFSDDDEANDDSASDPKPVLRVSRKVQSARSKNRENVNPNCEDTKPRKSTRHQESNAFVSLPPKKNKSHKPPDVKEVIQYERDMAIPDIVHNGVTLASLFPEYDLRLQEVVQCNKHEHFRKEVRKEVTTPNDSTEPVPEKQKKKRKFK